MAGANLSWANLEGAQLYSSIVHEANLVGANLHGADLDGGKLEGEEFFETRLRSARWDRSTVWPDESWTLERILRRTEREPGLDQDDEDWL